MKLKRLLIEEGNSWDKNKGKYVGSISWEGEDGDTKLLLSPEISERLLAFIGPVLVEFSHRAATEIAKNLQFAVTEAQKSPAIEMRTES